jgi:cytochrome c biogenesis protein CcdA
MPVWLELLVLMMLAYVLGLAICWLAWGRAGEQGKRGSDG